MQIVPVVYWQCLFLLWINHQVKRWGCAEIVQLFSSLIWICISVKIKQNKQIISFNCPCSLSSAQRKGWWGAAHNLASAWFMGKLVPSFFCPERCWNHLSCFWGSARQSHSWANLPIGDSPALSIWLDLHRSLPAKVSVIFHYGTSLICELEANITSLLLSFLEQHDLPF